MLHHYVSPILSSTSCHPLSIWTISLNHSQCGIYSRLQEMICTDFLSTSVVILKPPMLTPGCMLVYHFLCYYMWSFTTILIPIPCYQALFVYFTYIYLSTCLACTKLLLIAYLHTTADMTHTFCSIQASSNDRLQQ